MFRRSAMVLGVLGLLFSGVGSVSAAVLYNVTDLGTLPGGTASEATGINASGQVVGYADTSDGNYHAFLYSNGTMADLGTLGGAASQALGINAAGQVVGSAVTSSNYEDAFLYSNGSMADLGTLGGVGSTAYGVNTSGQVVGSAHVSSGYQHAFLYSNGSMADLGTLGGHNSQALGINVGGQVVGVSVTSSGDWDGFLYSNGTMADLGGFHPTAINDGGQVVGWSQTSSGSQYAFLYSDGTMTDLNSLVVPSSVWTLYDAMAINDSGQIVGDGRNASGQDHAFLLAPVLPGDANGDGTVNGADLNTVLSNYNQTGMTWAQGDFNGDGTVNGADLNIVLSNYNQSAGATAAVPEPSTLVLLGVGAIGLLAFAWRRRRGWACCLSGVAAVVAMLIAGSAQADVFNMGGARDPTTGTWTGAASLQFVTVGDPGNAADTTGYGSLPYTYQMGQYDVTAAQYCQFLNAVAATDAYGLYNSCMAPGAPRFGCGIILQNGTSGSYTYSVSPDRGVPGDAGYANYANFPVNYVSWGDAARFCNWLQNGQPTGPEGPGTTETGAYTLNGATSSGDWMTVTRNAGATYFIPSENEWYKAAYYKGGGTNAGYWLYPTRSDTAPSNFLSSTDANNANFYIPGNYTDEANLLTPVGAFAASPGPYGTYDQGGDVWQWNEANIDDSSRELRGGSWWNPSGSDLLAASNCLDADPTAEAYDVGFRVASVPEPGSIALVVAGGLCLLAYIWRRRRV